MRLADTSLGLIRYGGVYYGAATIEAACAFIAAPDNYVSNLCDRE